MHHDAEFAGKPDRSLGLPYTTLELLGPAFESRVSFGQEARVSRLDQKPAHLDVTLARDPPAVDPIP